MPRSIAFLSFLVAVVPCSKFQERWLILPHQEMGELLQQMDTKAWTGRWGKLHVKMRTKGAAGCGFCTLKRMSRRCETETFCKKGLGMNCLHQDMEKAFDALAVFDTRPEPWKNCHVFTLHDSYPQGWLQRPLVEQSFFDSIMGQFIAF